MKPGEMSSIQYLSNRELHPDIRPPSELTGGFGYTLARHLPHLLREKKLDFGQADKVFSSQWLSEEEVIVGTKCNRLFVVDTTRDRMEEVPGLRHRGEVTVESSCGIHCISTTPDGRHLATGGCNPNELALYRLPELQPIAVGITHRDWIFDMQWITDSLLITGSRDSTMALWSISPVEDSPGHLAEDVPKMEPIFKFTNVPTESMKDYMLAGERVRSLTYNKHQYMLGSLQTNPCGAAAYIWDAYIFQQVSRIDLPYCAENVCMELDEDGSELYAVGSRSHVTFIDGRMGSKSVRSIRSLDRECGVRSLQFNKHLLSIGTGAGHLYFYDIRAQNYLNHDVGRRSGAVPTTKKDACCLKVSPGWLRHDQTYRDFFSGFPEPPNAIYTHCYSPMRTKLFTAGGPLPLGLCGNYAAVWL